MLHLSTRGIVSGRITMTWKDYTRAEKVDRPLFAVDANGRVQVWNAAMERLVGWSAADVVNKPWHEVIGQLNGQEWLLDRSQRGLRMGELELRTPRGEHLRLVVTAWPVAPTDAVTGVMCWIEQVMFAPSDPRPAYSCVEIETANDRFGQILRVADVGPELVGRRCFEAIAHRAAPCTSCPARNAGHGVQSTVIFDRDLNLMVVRANRLSRHTAKVYHQEVGGELFASLVRARLDALSERYKLSHRERDVLYGLAGGASIDEIALGLAITPRTIKFHTANVLKKLDLESRLQLVRLALGAAAQTALEPAQSNAVRSPRSLTPADKSVGLVQRKRPRAR
ncbi:MAG: PAS domain-containing protein [Myxococcales bacterium]|nr:PAS domain-containing protein [Myxococcales bacterium]